MSGSNSNFGDEFVDIGRSALGALASGGNLEAGKTYAVTDFPAPGCLAGNIIKVFVNATDASTLANDVDILTTFWAQAWEGEVNWNSATFSKIEDHLGNQIHGGISIANFPWGSPTHRLNVVEHGAVWYQSCDNTNAVFGNHIHSGAYADTRGSDIDIRGLNMKGESRLFLNGGGNNAGTGQFPTSNINGLTLKDGGTFTASGDTGDFQVLSTTIGEGSLIQLNTGSATGYTQIRYMELDAFSRIFKYAGSNSLRLETGEMSGYSNIYFQGDYSEYTYYARFAMSAGAAIRDSGKGGRVSHDNFSISELSTYFVQTTDAESSYYNQAFHIRTQSNIYLRGKIVVPLTQRFIQRSTSANSSQMVLTDIDGTRVFGSELSQYGRLELTDVTGGIIFYSNISSGAWTRIRFSTITQYYYNDLDSYSRMFCDNAASLLFRYNKGSSGGYYRLAAPAGSAYRVEYCNVHSAGQLWFDVLCTAAQYAYMSEVGNGSNVRMRGVGYFNRSHAKDGLTSSLTANNLRRGDRQANPIL